MTDRCSECKEWSDDIMEDYIKLRKSLDSKAKKSDTCSSKAAPSSQPSKADDSKALEERINNNMTNMFDRLMSEIRAMKDSQANNNNPVSAPLTVPDCATSPGSAGGKVGVTRPTTLPDYRPSGEVLSGPKDPPQCVHDVLIAKSDDELAKHNVVDNARDFVGSLGVGDGQCHGLPGPYLGTQDNVSGRNVNVDPPATFSPSHLLFPPSGQPSSLFTPSQSFSLPSIPSSSSLGSTPFSSSVIVSSSSSSFPPGFSVADHNTNILRLSKGYVNIMSIMFSRGYPVTRDWLSEAWPGLIDDYDKDHQGGDSVLWNSLTADAKAKDALEKAQVMNQRSFPSFPSAHLPSSSSSFSSLSQASAVWRAPLDPLPSSAWSSSSSSGPQFPLSGFGSVAVPGPSASSLSSSSSALSTPAPFSAPPGFPGGPLASSDLSVSSWVRPSTSGYVSSGVTGQGGLSGSGVTQVLGAHPIASVLSGHLLSQGSAPSVCQSVSGQGFPLRPSGSGFMSAPQAALGQVPSVSGVQPSGSQSVPVTASFVPSLQSVGCSVPSSVYGGSSIQGPSSFPQGFMSDAEFQFPGPPPRRDNLDHTVDLEPPEVPPSNVREYRRMLEYIIALFPEAKGEQAPVRVTKSLFEGFFNPQESPQTPFPSLSMFERVRQSLNDADERLVKNASSSRGAKNLIPRRRRIYTVTSSSSSSEAPELNESLSAHIGVLKPSRSVGISYAEATALETCLRNQSETLSHSMWVLSGLLAYVRNEGFVPKDPALFSQLISSLSMGLAQLSNSSAGSASFLCQKRRESFVGHLSPFFPEPSRAALLRAPVFSAPDLFREEDVSNLLSVARDFNTFKQHQDLYQAARRSSRPPSPRRSPSQLRSPPRYARRSRSPSPKRSPKRVRFAQGSKGKSPPPPAPQGFPQ